MIEYDIVTETLNNVNGNDHEFKYKVLKSNGTYYKSETPDRVIEVLEEARERNLRLRLYYGDKDDGHDWEECFDVYGYVGRTSGRIKSPILLANSRSIGGGTILTECLVKIQTARGKVTLWQHEKYHRLPENLNLRIV